MSEQTASAPRWCVLNYLSGVRSFLSLPARLSLSLFFFFSLCLSPPPIDARCESTVDAARSKGMNWSMLPLQANMNVRVGSHVRGGVGFPTFPSWLGKNSSKNKRKRLLAELTLHMSDTASAAAEDVRMQYLSSLRSTLLKPLLEEKSDGVQKTIDMMDEYGLSRDDLFETLAEFKLKGEPDLFAKIDTKVTHPPPPITRSIGFGGC